MKKLYTVIGALLFAAVGFAQSTVLPGSLPAQTAQKSHATIHQKMTTPLVQAPAATPVAPKAAPTIYWSDDFSNAANWAFGHANGTTGDWVIGATALSFVGVVNSTSGPDFAGFDSDAAGQGVTNDAWIQTVNPVNLTGVPVVQVNWEQTYQRFQDDVFIDVSVNGATWTSFQVNDDINTNQSTPNPDFRSLDISSVAANQATVWIRFRYFGAWDYAWAIDDISITDALVHELIVDDIYFNSFSDTLSTWHYSQIPIQHSSEDTIIMAAAVNCAGSANQTNVQMHANITGQMTWSESSPLGVGINAGSIDSVQIDSIFLANQVGNYAIEVYTTADSLDEQPLNDTISRTWEVGTNVYARDFDDFSGGFSYAAGTGIHSMAMLFEIRVPDSISGLEVMFFNNGTAGTTDGAVVNFHIYDGSFTPVQSNSFVVIDTSYFNQWVTVPFDPPLAVTPGDFLVGYEMLSAGDEVWIGQGDMPNISPPVTTFVNVDNAGWGWIDATPLIRMNVTGNAANCFVGSTAAVTDATCASTADGSIAVTASGGTNYGYAWSTGATTATLSNIMAGTYTVTVSDTACASTVQTYTVGPTAISSTFAVTNDLCSAGIGAITASATGGNGNLSYLWSNGDTTAAISALVAGSYTLTVTDTNACVYDSVIVVMDSITALTAVPNIIDENCSDGLGAISITVSGGATPYSYSWSNGSMTATTGVTSAGTYSVTFTDANGCTGSADSLVISNVVPNTVFSSSITNEICGNGSGLVSASASGGNAPYTYVWSTGSTSTVISGLSAGTYTITSTDGSGCVDSATYSVIDTTIVITASTAVTQATCGNTNGSITVTPTNGAPVYGYAWSNGQAGAALTNLDSATYIVTITDGNGCTGVDTTVITNTQGVTVSTSSTQSNCGSADGDATATPTTGTSPYSFLWDAAAGNQTTAMATGLSAGSYDVVVTDANTCTVSATVSISDASSLNGTNTAATDATCGASDGSASITPTGGVLPYTYTWDASAGGQSTQTATGLTIGSYNVSVEDSVGCLFANNITVGGSAAVVFNISSVPTNCGATDGSATASVTSGAGTITYMWSDGQTTQTATGLGQGMISVVVTDTNTCSSTDSVLVSANSIPTIDSSTIVDASCNGGSDGSIATTISGGTAPYTYIWTDNNDTTNTASSTMSGSLSAGIYDLVLTDNTGCLVNFSDTVGEPDSLSAGFTATEPLCNGGADGSATVTAAGGTSPYSYAWASGATTATATGLTAGAEMVTITDANGCTHSDSASVTEPALLVPAVSVTDISCNGLTDGDATASATGGTTMYSYLWNGGATTATISNLGAATYTVTITDANGCAAIDSGAVAEPDAITLATLGTDVGCFGSSTGNANAAVTGGTGLPNYLWSDGTTTQLNSNIAAGDYTVTVTDAVGCTATSSVTINGPVNALTITEDAIVDETQAGSADGSVSITPGGGWGSPFTFDWSNFDNTEDITGLSAGDYTVTVTDDGGCEATLTVTVGVGDYINETIDGTTLSVVPNPNNGVFQVFVTTRTAQSFDMTIFNSIGQVVATDRLSAAGNHVNQVNLSGLDSGVYFLDLRNENGRMMRRVVVQ